MNKQKLLARLAQLEAENNALKLDKGYGILTRQGLDMETERRRHELPGAFVVFIDLDYLHALNSKFGSYEPVNAMIRRAFTFRHDDLIFSGKWQSGDEIVFIVRTDPAGFIARLNQSLAANGLSATSAAVQITDSNLTAAVETAAQQVQAAKQQRGIQTR